MKKIIIILLIVVFLLMGVRGVQHKNQISGENNNNIGFGHCVPQKPAKILVFENFIRSINKKLTDDEVSKMAELFVDIGGDYDRILVAMAAVESSFKQHAYRDDEGSVGLLQVQKRWYSYYCKKHQNDFGFDPAVNIHIATKIVHDTDILSRKIFPRLNDDERAAFIIASYNQGVGRAIEDFKQGRPRTKHVQKTMRYLNRINSELSKSYISYLDKEETVFVY